MKRLDEKTLGKLAYYVLAEISARWRVRRKYLKTYRVITYFLGHEISWLILTKLREGGYIDFDGDYVVCLKPIQVQKPLHRLEAELRNYVCGIVTSFQR